MTAPNPGVTPATQYVSFTADVNPFTTQALLGLCAQLANKGVSTVHLFISTPGGQVREGMAAYNILRSMPFKLITHNMGNVDSIGNVIFLAGEERYACPNATFMFHGVGVNLDSGRRMERKDLREVLRSLDADTLRMASIIEQRATFAKSSEVKRLFLEGTVRDANYAKSHGIVHDIRDVKVPAGSPIHQLVFQR